MQSVIVMGVDQKRVSVTHLLALDKSIQRLDLEFNAQVLEAFVLVVDVK